MRVLRQNNGRWETSTAQRIDQLRISKNRQKILRILGEEPLFPSQIAQKMGLNEQTIYYHLKALHRAEIIKIVEKKPIRGTIAHKYSLTSNNILIPIKDEWYPFKTKEEEKDQKLSSFLAPFIEDHFTGKFVVGNPDPHGPFKARARDGHYAIDLGLFLGQLGSLSGDFSVALDVDTDIRAEDKNIIVVGGPVTNLVMEELNRHMPVTFVREDIWRVKGKDMYAEDATGVIARIPNPYNPHKWCLILAGTRGIGTKTAVIGLTRFTEKVLSKFSGQKRFYTILQGFDLDGDSKIDAVEVLE
ncbi:MAG: helix-turn-helix domain-containing protein [Candidatus Woesearchaeota archaeon]